MENRKGNIQIPKSLFGMLIQYHLLGNTENTSQIQRMIEEKLDRVVQHELYQKYKTDPDKTEREIARKEYLDKIGVKDDFRW